MNETSLYLYFIKRLGDPSLESPHSFLTAHSLLILWCGSECTTVSISAGSECEILPHLTCQYFPFSGALANETLGGMTNSKGLSQTTPSGAVWSGSLYAYATLPEKMVCELSEHSIAVWMEWMNEWMKEWTNKGMYELILYYNHIYTSQPSNHFMHLASKNFM